MTVQRQPYNDIDTYIASFGEEERQELAHAEAALDLALLVYQARKGRGLTQNAAAAQAGLRQQAISRWERSHPNVQLNTLRRYLTALGYTLELVIRDAKTGQILSPSASPNSTQGIA
jgi:DNA-binding XRE family transcriptional regulator